MHRQHAARRRRAPPAPASAASSAAVSPDSTTLRGAVDRRDARARRPTASQRGGLRRPHQRRPRPCGRAPVACCMARPRCQTTRTASSRLEHAGHVQRGDLADAVADDAVGHARPTTSTARPAPPAARTAPAARPRSAPRRDCGLVGRPARRAATSRPAAAASASHGVDRVAERPARWPSSSRPIAEPLRALAAEHEGHARRAPARPRAGAIARRAIHSLQPRAPVGLAARRPPRCGGRRWLRRCAGGEGQIGRCAPACAARKSTQCVAARAQRAVASCADSGSSSRSSSAGVIAPAPAQPRRFFDDHVGVGAADAERADAGAARLRRRAATASARSGSRAACRRARCAG